MIFTPLALGGAWLIDPERHADNRGFFARWFDEDQFAEHGLVQRFEQSSVSWNPAAGTLRGMHFQTAPHAETKVVRCTRGALHDVIVDLRPGSPTYAQWVAAELTADNRLALYIPAGFAHGFVTLTTDTEAAYMIAGKYVPAASSGLRWDDPTVAIEWPREVAVISERDAALPLLA